MYKKKLSKEKKIGDIIMMNIQWESIKCYICHSKMPPEPILLKGKPFTSVYEKQMEVLTKYLP